LGRTSAESCPQRPRFRISRSADGLRGSNPVPCCFAVRGRDGRRPLTCDADLPMLTARARRGPVVPDAVRTQHGPASLDYLLAKPDRAGSSPWETVIGAGRGLCGVVRCCPLGTGQDCCEWHVSGTAGEDDPWHTVAPSVQLDRGVRLVLGDHCIVGKSPKGLAAGGDQGDQVG
jgi:hypothetical protein